MFHHVRAKQLSELAAAGRQLDDLPRHKRVRVPEINKLAVKRVACASNTVDMLCTYLRTSHALHLYPPIYRALLACLTCPPAGPSASYRTHNGILGAASEVVSLLLQLFPHSVGTHWPSTLHPLPFTVHPHSPPPPPPPTPTVTVSLPPPPSGPRSAPTSTPYHHQVDALEKDRGHFDGPKPVLLRDTTTDDLAMMLMGSDPAHSQIEFGAHQAVLVRNQAAKERLPAEFASALKLTIFEAKGLEFDDVFVVDFFEDSPADERTWRVVTGCWEARPTSTEAGAPPAAATTQASAAAQAAQDGAALGFARPTRGAEPFDAVRHSLLNEELKMFCRLTATRTWDPPTLQNRSADPVLAPRSVRHRHHARARQVCLLRPQRREAPPDVPLPPRARPRADL